MTVLVFHPHLNESRVNQRLMAEITKYRSDKVIVWDEYAMYPDGKIDVQAEQQLLMASDRIVLQFPFYWYSSPSLLKKWEDEVLLHGWAYGSGGTALHGKELLLAISAGAAPEKYHIYGEFGYTMEDMLLPFMATSNLIGTKFVEPFILQGVMQNLTDEQLEDYARNYVDYILKSK
ncbi:NAD(P)H-dependent oxidoreductase [Lactobacillus xylocopicola]|nr:NAD(P)H-dependent oxidoreductase [Lactobacillus xylocopicola]